MAPDWLVFKLAPEVSGRGELGDGVQEDLTPPLDAVEKAAKKALGKDVSSLKVTETGARLEGTTAAQAAKVAGALEKLVGPVGIAEIRTNEWWDLADFKVTRLPLG